MTEQAAASKTVSVKCLGISIPTDFFLSPMGLESQIFTFNPGKGTQMSKPYAEYLAAMDPTKFIVSEETTDKPAEPVAASAQKMTPAERMAKARAARKTK